MVKFRTNKINSLTEAEDEVVQTMETPQDKEGFEVKNEDEGQQEDETEQEVKEPKVKKFHDELIAVDGLF